jgi:hypothetical protein
MQFLPTTDELMVFLKKTPNYMSPGERGAACGYWAVSIDNKRETFLYHKCTPYNSEMWTIWSEALNFRCDLCKRRPSNTIRKLLGWIKL